MALPAITKTWTFSVNNSLPTTGTYSADSQRLMFSLKNYLKSVGWTVKASCNSTSVPNYYDGVDRWAAYTNIVWTAYGQGSAHSWIVLSAPAALSPTLEVLLSACATNGTTGDSKYYRAGLISSWTGFTGGNATTDPTATRSVSHCAVGYDVLSQWRGNTTALTPFSCAWHGMSATDGTARIVVCWGNAVMFHWSFEKITGSSIADPSAVFMSNGNQYASAYTHWNDNAVFYNSSTATAGFYLTAEAYGAAMVGQNITSQNDRGGGYWMGAVGIASATGGFRGRQGTLGDLWWGTSSVGYGTTIPDDGTKQFVQFNDMIFPWNGTTPLIA